MMVIKSHKCPSQIRGTKGIFQSPSGYASAETPQVVELARAQEVVHTTPYLYTQVF